MMKSTARSLDGPPVSSTRAAGVEAIALVLRQYLTPQSCRAVLDCGARHLPSARDTTPRQFMSYLREIKRAVRMLTHCELTAKMCLVALERFEVKAVRSIVEIQKEMDILTAQNAARGVCDVLGFSTTTMTKVLTALSELTRNVIHYAGRGEVCLSPLDVPRPGIEVVVRDNGPGIANLDEVLAGRVRSRTGMGVGLRGSKAISDEFAIQTAPGVGTTITFRKYVNT
jgi:serine/threonine-protein kinase RsbT